MLSLTGLRSRVAPAAGRFPAGRLLLDGAFAYLLFWAAHTLYRTAEAPVQMCDSAYALTVAEQWLARGTVDLTDRLPADRATREKMPGYVPHQDMPYQLLRHDNPRRPGEPTRIYYGYPLGSTVLSLPFVKKYVPDRGFSLFHPDGTYFWEMEASVQQRVAARVSALIVVLFYAIARVWCPPAVAALLAAGFAFGSPVWSTLSRGLWSHTWMVFWLSGAIALLAARRRLPADSWRADLGLGAALGTALFWLLFVRTQGALSVLAIGAHLLLFHRRLLAVTVLVGAAWSAGLVAWSLHTFGTVTPPTVYQPNAIDGEDVANRFFWLMMSPSRGLLVCCPYLAVVGAMLVGYRRHLAHAGLLLPAVLAVGAHTAVFSCYNGWHGGSSYGPRYFADMLPWFVVLAAAAVRAMADARPAGFSWRKAGLTALLAAGFGWGAFVHYRGANSAEAWWWNFRAVASGEAGAVKEWAHPQFLAGLTFKVNPDGSVTPLDPWAPPADR